MSFVQEKLILVGPQSSGTMDVYVYLPGNGDAIADIGATGYFSASRFIGTNGWVNGLIHVSASDGYSLFQVDDTGITAAALAPSSSIATLQAAVAALQITSAQLVRNVNNIAVVDMLGADYTMTNDEAESAVIIATNSGTGHTLTWPSTSAGKTPSAGQIVATSALTESITLAYEGGGGTVVLLPGVVNNISVSAFLGVVHLDQYVAVDARAALNGTASSAAANVDLTDLMFGTVRVFNGGAAQTFTINTGLLTANGLVYVSCEGAGGVTVTAGGGVTLAGGSAVLVSGESCMVVRDDLTETYRILR